jgi:hypothetical protein
LYVKETIFVHYLFVLQDTKKEVKLSSLLLQRSHKEAFYIVFFYRSLVYFVVKQLKLNEKSAREEEDSSNISFFV